MGNLSQYAEHESETIKAIYEWHEKMEASQDGPHRGRLGASIIGKPCDRELWYSFRQLYKREFNGRILRLFETGHLEEDRFVRELRGIGCTVHPIDPETGEQFEFTAIGGHFVCHPDAVALGIKEAPQTWHSIEIKTMGGTERHLSKDFNKVKNEGVKLAKPVHYAQMQVSMGLSGMRRAAYLCKKKATDEIHLERVKYDAECFNALMDRAKRIIIANSPLERCASRPDDFRCRFCDAFQLCWGTGKVAVPIPSKTCRSCCHSTPEIDDGEGWARWSCAKHNKDLSLADQNAACRDHLLLPGLVSFAEPVDADKGSIEFKNAEDDALWRHGRDKGMWTTEELMSTPGPLVGEKSVEIVKEALGATVAGFDDGKELTLVEKYPPEDSRKLWDGDPREKDAIAAILRENRVSLKEKPATFSDEAHDAYEFDGRILLVIYKEHNHAAIWEGVE